MKSESNIEALKILEYLGINPEFVVGFTLIANVGLPLEIEIRQRIFSGKKGAELELEDSASKFILLERDEKPSGHFSHNGELYKVERVLP